MDIFIGDDSPVHNAMSPLIMTAVDEVMGVVGKNVKSK
jgi:hypothetical protein